jgi:hypothetical protein
MSQTLILELSDEVYAAIRRQAVVAGTSPAHIAATSLEYQFSDPKRAENIRLPQTEAEQQAARERFEQHFGAVNLGYATGLDNEQIDADLAHEYADDHKVG